MKIQSLHYPDGLRRNVWSRDGREEGTAPAARMPAVGTPAVGTPAVGTPTVARPSAECARMP